MFLQIYIYPQGVSLVLSGSCPGRSCPGPGYGLPPSPVQVDPVWGVPQTGPEGSPSQTRGTPSPLSSRQDQGLIRNGTGGRPLAVMQDDCLVFTYCLTLWGSQSMANSEFAFCKQTRFAIPIINTSQAPFPFPIPPAGMDWGGLGVSPLWTQITMDHNG